MLHAGVLKKFGLYGLLRIALPLLPGGRAALGHAADRPLVRQHHLCRPGDDRAEAARLDARLFERDAHGLHLPRDRERQSSRHERRRHPDLRARNFDRACSLPSPEKCAQRTGTLLLSDLGGLAQGDAAGRVRLRPGRICRHRLARLRQLRRRSDGFLRRLPQRRGPGPLSPSSKSPRCSRCGAWSFPPSTCCAPTARLSWAPCAESLGGDARSSAAAAACRSDFSSRSRSGSDSSRRSFVRILTPAFKNYFSATK